MPLGNYTLTYSLLVFIANLRSAQGMFMDMLIHGQKSIKSVQGSAVVSLGQGRGR